MITRISRTRGIAGSKNCLNICRTISRTPKRSRAWMRMYLKKKKSTWSLAVLILKRKIRMRRSMLMVELLRGKEKREEENPGKIQMRMLIRDREFKVMAGGTINFKIWMRVSTIIIIQILIKIIRKINMLIKVEGLKIRFKKFKNRKNLSLNFKETSFWFLKENNRIN